MHAGKGLMAQYDGLNVATTTLSTAGSGSHSLQISLNTIGSTQWSALVGTNLQDGITSPMRVILVQNTATRASSWIYARLYLIGTLNLTTTSSEFTHNAATFPILRTVMGQANQPIDLIPIMLVTTATTTTAAVFKMDYVDQDGNATTGTIDFTMPSTATNAGSGFVLPLEVGDSAVRDVTNINISTTASAGAASIYGMEIIDYASTVLTTSTTNKDAAFRGFNLANITPGVATSGTATSLACFLRSDTNTSSNVSATIMGFYDS